MVTPTHNHNSPFEKLFQKPPNLTNLKVFRCLCYPWLKPYTNHKLESNSHPCVYLGPLKNQSGYACFDPSSGKTYSSRHVWFIEYIFPFKKLNGSSLASHQDINHPISTNALTHIYLPMQSPFSTFLSSKTPTNSPPKSSSSCHQSRNSP